MKYQGKSMMSLNEMTRLAIDYEGDGYVTGYPIVSGDDTYILNGVIEANEEYITINQWVPVFPKSLKPVSPQLNDNQQIVLDWLKKYHGEDPLSSKSTFETIYDFINDLWSGAESFDQLSFKQEAQVLQAFSQWVLEQEEKK